MTTAKFFVGMGFALLYFGVAKAAVVLPTPGQKTMALPPPAVTTTEFSPWPLSPVEARKKKGVPLPEYLQETDQNRHPSVSQFNKRVPEIGRFDTPMLAQGPVLSIPKQLTLKDAIALALRDNPDVRISELARVTDKYALLLAHHAFEPQFKLSQTAGFGNKGHPTYGLSSSVSLLSNIGTQYNFSYTNDYLGGTLGTLKITQPLLKGFGYVNKIPYLNALDTEVTNRLKFKNSVAGVIDTVITNYRTLVGDYNNLRTQQENLKQTKEQVRQYKLQVKAGKYARSDLVQQEAQLSSSRLAVLQQENTIETDYQAFIKSLGLIPTAKLAIVTKIDFEAYKIPKLQWAIKQALNRNIGYLQAVIGLRATKRALIKAKNDRLWDLSLVLQQNFYTPKAAAATSPAVAGDIASGPSAGFTLTVPIDDLKTKSELVNAKINLETAKLKLEQTKEDVVRQVMTSLLSLKNQKQQLVDSEQTVRLNQKALDDAQLKKKYGRVTTFEVLQLQNTLLNSQISLIGSEISYLNTITSFNKLLGITLDKWHVILVY